MKVLKYTILLVLSCSFVYNLHLRAPFPPTPKAADLTDHFGTEPAVNIYGPKHASPLLLAREGVTGEHTPITPIRNFSQEINPNNVVAGDLENTSYDASKIIKAHIAGIFIIFYQFNLFSS